MPPKTTNMPQVRVTDRDVERHFEALGCCRDVDEFEKLNRIGEGTYGTVYRARDRKTRDIVALKRVILHNESSEGVRHCFRPFVKPRNPRR